MNDFNLSAQCGNPLDTSCYQRYWNIPIDVLKEKLNQVAFQTRVSVADFTYDQFEAEEKLGSCEDRPLKSFADRFVYLG